MEQISRFKEKSVGTAKEYTLELQNHSTGIQKGIKSGIHIEIKASQVGNNKVKLDMKCFNRRECMMGVM